MNNLPPITKNLLIINVLCCLGAFAAQRHGVDLNDILGLHFFMASDFKPFQLVTYMFMHADFQHLFFNMFAVWMFGRTLEMVLGPKRFLTYYMVCGIGAALIQMGVAWLAHDYYFSLIGASGAVMGLLLAFGLMHPNNEIFIIPIPFPIKAKWFVIGYAVLEIVLGWSGAQTGVAHFAHVGGMLWGLALLLWWKKKGKIFF